MFSKGRDNSEGSSERSSVQMGPYRLERLLGEGGMGSVHLAVQEEPVRRKVALKLVKPGMDSKQVLSRFKLEQQNLARLSHPNIAQVFDAGLTPEGRPFFAMEYVDGSPITEYCDLKALPIESRLKLFMDVCRAVQHAHQRGIIHRDLKPANILVTENEGKPLPKIIDFGISKALTTGDEYEGLTVEPLTSPLTGMGMVVGTIGYMSPEQADIKGDVDTRSDVYSLGAVLYELLTGRPPFMLEDFKGMPLPVALLKLGSKSPLKPSSRINKTSETLSQVARSRALLPNRLIKTLKKDLDWIVMKSLEKSKERRYSSPLDLLEDLERFLGNRPVEAGPPSFVYVSGKFIKRNKFAVSAFLLFLIVAGVAFQRTRSAEKRAVAAAEEALNETQKTKQTLEIMGELITAPQVSRLGKDASFLQVLEEFEQKLDTLEGVDVGIIYELRLKLIQAYHNLSFKEKVQEQVQYLNKNYPNPEGVEEKTLLLVRTYYVRGLLANGKLDEAETLIEENIRIASERYPQILEWTLYQKSGLLISREDTKGIERFLAENIFRVRAGCNTSFLCGVLQMLSMLGEYQKAIDYADAFLNNNVESNLGAVDEILIYRERARSKLNMYDYQDALVDYKKAMVLSEEKLGLWCYEWLDAKIGTIECSFGLKQYEKGIAESEKIIRNVTNIVSNKIEYDSLYQRLYSAYGGCLLASGDYDKSYNILKMLFDRASQENEGRLNYYNTKYNYIYSGIRGGKYLNEALFELQQMLPEVSAAFSEKNPMTAYVEFGFAEGLKKKFEYAEAEKYYWSAWWRFCLIFGENHRNSLMVGRKLLGLYLDMGNVDMFDMIYDYVYLNYCELFSAGDSYLYEVLLMKEEREK